jgi:heptosyltransferase III
VQVRRLLLVQLRYMGDVLLCTPAVRAARRAYPHARIDFLTEPLGAEVLEGNQYLDELLVAPRGVPARLGMMRELRGRGYDAAVDFHSIPSSAWFVRATGARYRIGVRGRGPRNLAYTHLLPRVWDPVYTARQKLGVLEPLGIDASAVRDLSLDVVLEPKQRERAAEIWERHGLSGGEPVVAFSPVSREPFKQWGAERWAGVADAVAAAGARVLITSGPGERAQVDAVVEQMRHPAVWDYGRTSLRELAALYERCALWVGNDGGPKHVAVAAGTPTVTVNRWRIGATWTDADAAVPHVFVERPPPQGCDLRCARCGHLGCLDAVTPAEVLPVVLTAMGRLGAEIRAPS